MSNETKHAPGPWINTGLSGVWPNQLFHVEMRTETSAGHVATIEVLNNTREAREKADANAHLIAAAPDMLAALRPCIKQLKAWMKDHGDDRESQEAISLARAAIAKAEGM